MEEKTLEKLIQEKEEQIKTLTDELNALKAKFLPAYKPLHAEEKIDIFMSYFKGRTDVFPKLFINKYNPNIKYYMPVCINLFKPGLCNIKVVKCKDCPNKVYKILTRDDIKKHLIKSETIGIYPLLPDETCFFLAFDFDDKTETKNITQDITAFLNTCKLYNIPITIERSRSGKGYHLWLFFERNIKALTARRLGSLLLSKTLESHDDLSIKTFDRMFPNQDYMPKGGLGNLIALPFQTEPRTKGNTLFLDNNFNIIQNQFEYLSTVHKMTEKEVFDRINKLTEETIDLSNSNLNIQKELKNEKKNNFSYPNSINVILNNMIYIEKNNLSTQVKSSFKRLATFANPEYFKMQRLRMSTYKIPMIIDCSKQDEEYLKLPRGTFEYLSTLCEEKNVKMNISDNRNAGKKIKVKFNGTLREEQNLALNKMLEFETGILHAPTGFGKTVLSCKLIEKRGVNTLIITHKLDLLYQWKKEIKEFLNIEPGQIGDGKNEPTNIIDVASIQTLWNRGNPNDIVKNYGMIIFDECHHLSAYTYEQAANKINSKYFYGMTATPDREDGHTPIIKMQCGDIRYEVDFKKFNEKFKLPMKVMVRNTHLQFTNPNITDYTLNEIKNLIVKDILRSETILKDVKKEFSQGKNILILTERIDHIEYFVSKLKNITSNLFVYHGGLSKKILSRLEDLKETVKKNNDNKIIIATGSYIGEGFDDPTLDILFITMPISGITRVIQYTGRLHRKNEKKKEITVYDYVDDNFAQTRTMFNKRKRTYIKMGYEVIEDNRDIHK